MRQKQAPDNLNDKFIDEGTPLATDIPYLLNKYGAYCPGRDSVNKSYFNINYCLTAVYVPNTLKHRRYGNHIDLQNGLFLLTLHKINGCVQTGQYGTGSAPSP